MSGPRHLRWARAVVAVFAALISIAYPRAFRRGIGRRRFVDVAHHQFTKALQTRGPAAAAAAVMTLLVADALRSAPALWRGAASGGSGARHVADDLAYVVKGVVRRPGHAVLVVGVLGLGIGVGAATLTTLNRVVLNPFGTSVGDRVVYLVGRGEGFSVGPQADAIARWRESAPALEQIEILMPLNGDHAHEGVTESLPAMMVTPGLAPMLGVRPVVGRLLGEVDAQHGPTPAVMVSERFWIDTLGAPAQLDHVSVLIGKTRYPVAGVWPGPVVIGGGGAQPEIFLTNSEQLLQQIGGPTYVMARLAPNMTVAQAQAEVSKVSAGIASFERSGVLPVVETPATMLGRTYVRSIWLAAGASVLLMVVAVANASNLMLSRAMAHTQELGLRAALGGTSWRLLQLAGMEAALLSIIGGAAALAVSATFRQIVATQAAGRFPVGHFSGIDGSTWLCVGAGVILSTALCLLIPFSHTRRIEIRSLLTSGSTSAAGPHRSRIRQGLIGLQAGIGVVLVSASILMLRSFDELTSFDVGFDLESQATLSVVPADAKAPAAATRMVLIEESLRALPGVLGVQPAWNALFSSTGNTGTPALEAAAVNDKQGYFRTDHVRPGYLEQLGARIRSGRLFEKTDGDDVVIVNETFARTYGGDVVGRLLHVPRREPRRIVGVIADIQDRSRVDSSGRLVQVYSVWTSGPYPGGFTRFVLRTSGDPSAVLAAAVRQVKAVDPSATVRSAETGTVIAGRQTVRQRFMVVLLCVLASIGVVMAVAGVYGAAVLDARLRTREAGVRVALGATRAQVMQSILWPGLRPTMAGIGVGLVVWMWASATLEALLFRISPRDPVSMAVAVVVLMAVSTFAGLVPARRASRVDPSITLRVE